MTPQELRASILQLAIQGKLVEQRSEEGTGEELYRQIQDEKQELIKSGKTKKEKPLSEISENEIPFDIPESWKWVRFGNISNIIGTGLVRSSGEQYAQAQYYYFKMNNIGNFDGECYFDNMNMVNATLEEYERYKIESGDFLFNTRNSRELVGKTAVVPKISLPIILNNNILKIRFFGEIIPEYMNYFFISPLGREQLIKFITNTTNVAAIYQKQLITLYVPLPPLAEQKRIVAKIEELLPYIDRYEQAWSKLEEFNKKFPIDMQKSVLQMAIQGKLVEQLPEEGTGEELYQQIQAEKQELIKSGKIKKEKPLPEITEDEIPFDIPENWIWAKLGELFAIERGSSPRPIKAYLTSAPDGVNWIKIGDSEVGAKYITSTNEKITPEGATKSRLVSVGDFIISNSMSYGRPYIMAIEGYVHDGWNIIHNVQVNGCDAFDKEYLYYVLSSNLLKEQMKNKAAGGVVKNIKSDYLRDLIIPVPPLAEQKRIVAKLEEILPLCEKLK